MPLNPGRSPFRPPGSLATSRTGLAGLTGVNSHPPLDHQGRWRRAGPGRPGSLASIRTGIKPHRRQAAFLPSYCARRHVRNQPSTARYQTYQPPPGLFSFFLNATPKPFLLILPHRRNGFDSIIITVEASQPTHQYHPLSGRRRHLLAAPGPVLPRGTFEYNSVNIGEVTDCRFCSAFRGNLPQLSPF